MTEVLGDITNKSWNYHSNFTVIDNKSQLTKEKKPLEKEICNDNIASSNPPLTPSKTKTPEKKTPKSKKLPICSPGFDAATLNNPLFGAHIVKEIMSNLRERETKYLVSEGFLSKQIHVNEESRMKIVNYIISCVYAGKQNISTLFLAINYIDRYLEKKVIRAESFQLLALTSLFIASKHEESEYFSAKDIVSLSKQAFGTQLLFESEAKILSCLGFCLSSVTILPFLRRYLTSTNSSPEIQFLTSYFVEMSLLYSEFSHMLPSKVAAAALYLARKIEQNRSLNNAPVWDESCQYYSELNEGDLIPLAKRLSECCKDQMTRNSALNKIYSQHKKLEVTLLVKDYFLNDEEN